MYMYVGWHLMPYTFCSLCMRVIKPVWSIGHEGTLDFYAVHIFPDPIDIHLNWTNIPFYLAQTLAATRSIEIILVIHLILGSCLSHKYCAAVSGWSTSSRLGRHMCDDVYRAVEDISCSLPTPSPGLTFSWCPDLVISCHSLWWTGQFTKC